MVIEMVKTTVNCQGPLAVFADLPVLYPILFLLHGQEGCYGALKTYARIMRANQGEQADFIDELARVVSAAVQGEEQRNRAGRGRAQRRPVGGRDHCHRPGFAADRAAGARRRRHDR